MKNYDNPVFRDAQPEDLIVYNCDNLLENKNYSAYTSDEQRTENAIVWIDSLDPKEGYKKTIGQLGIRLKGNINDWDSVKDLKEEGMYCCLGVACVEFSLLKDEYTDLGNLSNFSNGYDSRLEDLLGLNFNGLFFDREKGRIQVIEMDKSVMNCLMGVNDHLHEHDPDFSNMRSFILENLSLLFKPEVSEGLKKHYNK